MQRIVRLLLLLIFVSCQSESARSPLVVGSKNFSESVLLGELVAQQLENAGCSVDRRLNLGGTLVCDTSIVAGSLDAYVEYSGTALTAILHQPIASTRNEVDRVVQREYAKRGLVWGPNLGFNNTFAMLVRKGEGLERISDLARVADRFQPGFGYEFVERPDGWPGLQKAYGFTFAKTPKTMDLGLTYRALAAREVDLIAGNSTDGLIESLDLVMLEDDRGYFPPYDAAIVMRRDIDQKCPGAMKALGSLGGKIDDATMRRLNFEIDGEKRDVAEVVREFLAK